MSNESCIHNRKVVALLYAKEAVVGIRLVTLTVFGVVVKVKLGLILDSVVDLLKSNVGTGKNEAALVGKVIVLEITCRNKRKR